MSPAPPAWTPHPAWNPSLCVCRLYKAVLVEDKEDKEESMTLPAMDFTLQLP